MEYAEQTLMQSFNSSPISSYDELSMEIRNSQIKYDLEVVKDAYNFAEKYHKNQTRKSGEPLIVHPLSVAAYAVRLNLGTVSVVAALLHDVVEYTDVTIDEIDDKFGTEVAYIVDGMSNIKRSADQFQLQDESAQEIHHLLIKSAGDIRVLILRLADKLHNTITIKYLSEKAQIEHAERTRKIFAPLAEYLSLNYFSQVLYDICFEILNPKEFKEIKDQYDNYRNERSREIMSVSRLIKESLHKYNLGIHKIYGREKGIYSTYKKLKNHEKSDNNSIDINKIFDTAALSVVVESIEECYVVLGVLHNNWEYISEQFKDYIVKPKPNGYRAIHTILINEGEPIEVQIKTLEMHEYNEYGPASHISYKLNGGGHKISKLDLSWVKSAKSWLDDPENTEAEYKIETFTNSIFVFTPKGEVIRLDRGSTPIDFAFHIHTDIGIKCTGFRVNGKLASMDTELKTGDIIEVLMNKKQQYAKPGWLKFAKMNSTKYKIRKSLRAYKY